MIYSPCKDCQKRKVGCHSQCEDYLAFRSECDYAKMQRHLEVKANEYSMSKNRMKRRKNK